MNPDLSDFPGFPAESGLRREKRHILLVSTDFSRLRAESAFRQREKKDKNLLDNPKKEKTRFGLVGRKVYRKVFSTFDLLVLTEFS